MFPQLFTYCVNAGNSANVLNLKMPELLRRSQSVATFFSSNFGCLKEKKKGLCTGKGILLSLFMKFFKKKKGHWSKRSAYILVFYWLHAVNKGLAPQTAAAHGFQREIKTPVFSGRKNAGLRKNSEQKFHTFLSL